MLENILQNELLWKMEKESELEICQNFSRIKRLKMLIDKVNDRIQNLISLMMKPKLINITFQTKTGTYIAEKIVSNSRELTEIETDEHIMYRCFRNKLEGFKKQLIENPKTQLPQVLSVEFIKELGL